MNTTVTRTADPVAIDREALSALLLRPESPVSDAPVHVPASSGALLLALLLAPAEPERVR